MNVWRPLWGRGWGCSGLGVGGTDCSGRSVFVFFVKENWICAMIRHTESNIDVLLTRNFPFNFDIRQWRHSLMTPLHCLWAKSNNRTRGQFECDVTWFLFLFWFHSFTCTVLLLFHSLLKGVGGSFKIGLSKSRGWKKIGRRWTRGMDVHYSQWIRSG